MNLLVVTSLKHKSLNVKDREREKEKRLYEIINFMFAFHASMGWIGHHGPSQF